MVAATAARGVKPRVDSSAAKVTDWFFWGDSGTQGIHRGRNRILSNEVSEMLSLGKEFADRRDAGRVLARSFLCSGAARHAQDGIVLGLPRGGVPVAYEVARALDLALDVFIVRKLGVPGFGELAMGAITTDGTVAINQDVIQEYGITQDTIDAVAAREKLEIERQELAYRKGRPAAQIEGRTAILVDDGIATGASMLAAARALRRSALKVIVAVPVAARGTCEKLRKEVDEVICACVPWQFYSVGGFYQNFEQTTDEEVRTLLSHARTGRVASKTDNQGRERSSITMSERSCTRSRTTS
jgi:putative phosphoribosyl transferase